MSNENAGKEESILETFPKTDSVIELSGLPESGLVPAEQTETKATIDGVWIVDGRLAVCDTEEEAVKLYQSCFHIQASAIPSDRFPEPGEKVLHYRKIAMYGSPE
jgi:hypothetical protein